jgi:hypothetical protein
MKYDYSNKNDSQVKWFFIVNKTFLLILKEGFEASPDTIIIIGD